MDDVLPKSQKRARFRSEANAKASRSIKVHPVTLDPLSVKKVPVAM